ncbi:MAG: outer membrane protein transport protein [Desulfobacterales bacterium]|nr:outer membrane protein transport protein [Desulfobacterales bacterium]
MFGRLIAYTPKSILLYTFFVLFSVSSCYGSGFGIFTQGASALGQADAVVAHSDDPSAVFFNPALITNLPGTQIEVGTTIIMPSREFKSDLTGHVYTTEDKVYYPSTFYLTHALTKKISTGLGVFNSFGLGTTWDDKWEGRYLTTNSEIETYNINPVVTFQITPRISFGAGLDFLWLEATLEKKLSSGLSGVADINQKFSGDGNGTGYNIGVHFNMSDTISLGASYRSEIDVDIDGNVTFNLPLPLFATLLPNAGGHTTLRLPQQFFAAIAYQPFEKLLIEAGLRWEDWSSFKQLKIDLDQAIGGNTSTVDIKDWHDTYALNLGMQYHLNKGISLLAGYLYGEDPIPNHSLEPSIPDSNTHLFCVGTNIKYNNFKIVLSYAYQLQETRHKNNTIGELEGTANGEYHTDFHMVGFSLVYRL